MEQLWFSRGLITPLILYCRVISSRMVMPYCDQSFLEQVSSVFVSRRLSTYDCVSPNVTLLMQYGLYRLLQDSKTFPLAKIASIHAG